MHGDKAPSGANRSNTPNQPLRRARGQVALALTTPLTGPTPDSPSWVLNLTQLAPNRLSRAVGAASQCLTRCASALLAGWLAWHSIGAACRLPAPARKILFGPTHSSRWLPASRTGVRNTEAVAICGGAAVACPPRLRGRGRHSHRCSRCGTKRPRWGQVFSARRTRYLLDTSRHPGR